MTPEERSLLENTMALAKENNKILRSIRRSNRWSSIFRVIYWVVIIGLGLGTYYFLQPYLMSAVNIINQGQAAIKSLQK